MRILPIGIISYVGKEKGVLLAIGDDGEQGLFISAESKPLRWVPIGEIIAEPATLIAQPEED